MKPCRILSISDLHLGHHRVPSEIILNRFYEYVMPHLPTVDLLLISGDVFDRSLQLTDRDTRLIISWILDIFKLADAHNIYIRLIRGTYSHDRDQSTIFQTLHEKHGYTSSFKYVNHLDIEYIEAFDLKLLYLPDDLPYASADDCLKAVQHCLNQVQWTTVDYVMCHGYFEHVLPPNIPTKPKVTYAIQQFSFVQRYVLCGHIHEQSAEEHVLYNGSFERLAHNEESPKGCYLIDDDGTKASIHFIENKDASTFHTIDVSTYDTADEAISAYLEALKPCLYREHSTHIRAIHANVEVRNALRSITRKKYPHIDFSVKTPKLKKSQEEKTDTLPEDDLQYLSAPLRDALPDMVLAFLDKSPETLTSDRIRHHLNTTEL